MQTITTIGLDIAKSVFQDRQPIPRRLRAPWEEPSTASAADVMSPSCSAAFVTGGEQAVCALTGVVGPSNASDIPSRRAPYGSCRVVKENGNAEQSYLICMCRSAWPSVFLRRAPWPRRATVVTAAFTAVAGSTAEASMAVAATVVALASMAIAGRHSSASHTANSTAATTRDALGAAVGIGGCAPRIDGRAFGEAAEARKRLRISLSGLPSAHPVVERSAPATSSGTNQKGEQCGLHRTRYEL